MVSQACKTKEIKCLRHWPQGYCCYLAPSVLASSLSAVYLFLLPPVQALPLTLLCPSFILSMTSAVLGAKLFPSTGHKVMSGTPHAQGSAPEGSEQVSMIEERGWHRG